MTKYQLTPAQAEVLRLLATGKSPAIIAKILGVTTHTVHFHTLRMRKKLKFHSTVQLILWHERNK